MTNATLIGSASLAATSPMLVGPSPGACCKAMTLGCLACSQGVSEEEFCKINPGKFGCPKPASTKPEGPVMCCEAMTPGCLACSQGVSEEEFCKTNPGKFGCPKTGKYKPASP